MAGSSETPSVEDQTTLSGLLNINANQNLILDLDSAKYVVSLQPMVKYLRHSPLAPTLTIAEKFPLVHLSKMFYQMGNVGISKVKRFKKPSDDQPKQTTGETGEFEHKSLRSQKI
ncbi:unnamed protein product [Lactuca saligna]|uniref:Uncharacterized protein n=1 Tax=Lactuca saligna TaxID=75948 RepID=A0AA35ZTV6_LACSI|nr:unnamed protein product [Lactuca saligna]